MRLVRVELGRMASRSLIIIAVIAGLVGVGIGLAGTYSMVRPLSDAQVEQAEQAFEQAQAEWEENGEEMTATCLEDEARERELSDDETIDFGCEQMAPQEEWFFPPTFELHDTIAGQLSGISLLLVFVTFLIGATATAAEISTGSMSAWLTFVPRRLPVFTSKVVAAALFALPVTAVLIGLYVAGLWWVHDVQGLTDGMTAAVWTETAWTSLRVVALGAVGAALGAALGVLLRHTAAVLGGVVGYLLVFEAMLGSLVARLQPWMLRLNLDGWVQGGTTYWVSECTVTSGGTECTSTEAALTFGHSALVLGVVTVVVLTVSALVFRRRDMA